MAEIRRLASLGLTFHPVATMKSHLFFKAVAVAFAGFAGFYIAGRPTEGTSSPTKIGMKGNVGHPSSHALLPKTRGPSDARTRLDASLIKIPFNYARYLSIPSLDADLSASDEWADLLKLTDEERTAFDKIGLEFVDGFSQAEIAHAELNTDDPEDVYLRIEPFPEEGSRLKERYVEEMQALLGYDRIRLMTAALGYSLESDFSAFGERRLHVRLSRYNGDRVGMQFNSYDTVDKLPEPLRANHTEDMLHRRRTGTGQMTPESVPLRFQRMLDFMAGR